MSAEDLSKDVQEMSPTVESSHMNSGDENVEDSVLADISRVPLQSDSDNMQKTVGTAEVNEGVELCNGDCDDKTLSENQLDSSHQDSKSQNNHSAKYNFLDSSESFQNEEKNQSFRDNDGWLDILGSGDLKKREIISGDGEETRPNLGDRVTLNIIGKTSYGVVFQEEKNFKFFLGDSDVVQGLDMAVILMEIGEISEIMVPSRLAYGKLGRNPDIPPNTDLIYEVELMDVEDKDTIEFSVAEKIKLGNEKKEKGNFWYSRGDYLHAVQCYNRAAEYLDDTNQNFENPPEELQNLLDTRLKVYNNMAAAHLKMEAYDAALKSVDFVLKIQPKNVKAHFRKGKILAAKGLIDEAIKEMKIAVKLEPETKVIHQEISKLLTKKKNEENAQKAMYKRMFGQDKPKPKPSKVRRWLRNWSLMVGSILAVALGIAVYRQLHSSG